MEIIEWSNVTFVTDGDLLPLIIIVAKLPGQSITYRVCQKGRTTKKVHNLG
jgi:hypothetical protein